MEKINIIVKLDNKEMPYKYRGEATINKDIIEFNDKKDNYIFDKKVQRLIKSSEESTIMLDFKNKNIKIKEKENELIINIEVKEINISKNNVKIIYIIDKNEIIFQIKEV